MNSDPNREAYLRMVERRPDVGGRFTNIRRIGASGGAGAFSLLFSARDVTTGKTVALKVYHPDQRQDAYRWACFEREALILQELANQPDIVEWVAPFSEFVETLPLGDEIQFTVRFAYYALEIASGSVADVIAEGGWDAERSLLVFRAMCRAIQRGETPTADRDARREGNEPMIDVSTAAVIDRATFVCEQPHFCVEPPGGDSFLATTPIAFIGVGDAFAVARIEACVHHPQRGDAEAILEGMVSRARRDVARYPSSARARANLGVALLNRRDFDGAASEFQTALQLDPRQYVAAASLARVKVLQGKLDEAENLYGHLRTSYPSDPGPLMGLADVAARRKNFDDAIRLWERVIELDREAALPRYHLGIILLIANRQQEAIAQLKAAVRRDVRSAALHHGLGVAYATAGNERRAVQAFKAALALAPGMVEAKYALSEMLLQQGRVDEAIDLLVELLRNNPDDCEGHDVLAGAYIRQGRFAAARAELYRAIQGIREIGGESPVDQARLFNNLGVRYWYSGDRDQAGRFFLRSLEVQPNAKPAPYHNLARLYLDARNMSRAQSVLDACTARFPEDEETRLLVAVYLETRGKHDEAIKELERLIQMDNAPAEAYALLGSLLVDEKHDLNAGLSLLEDGRCRFPSDRSIANDLAYAYLMDSRPADARTVLESVPEEASPNIALTATWGLLHLWEGNLNDGKAKYRRAEQAALQQGKKHLAQVVRQKMHLELARAHLRRGDLQAALRAVRAGLAVKARSSYSRDLTALAAELAKR